MPLVEMLYNPSEREFLSSDSLSKTPSKASPTSVSSGARSQMTVISSGGGSSTLMFVKRHPLYFVAFSSRMPSEVKLVPFR